MLPSTWLQLAPGRYLLPTFLPGQLLLSPGRAADYTALARFHYLPRRPATWCQVWTIRHMLASHPAAMPIAVAVLSHPTLACHARDRALNLSHLTPAEKRLFINTHLRTISRVIVHPTYRSLGLAAALVQCLLHHCPTRHTETLATMARAHRLFDTAGMQRFDPEGDDAPVYFLFDANGASAVPDSEHRSSCTSSQLSPRRPGIAPSCPPHPSIRRVVARWDEQVLTTL